MLSSGDVVDLQLGVPEGSEAGFGRPAVVLTANAILEERPTVIQVVPLSKTKRRSRSEIMIRPDELNGLEAESNAQCQHIRAVATTRISGIRGNVGPAVLAQMREVLALLLDINSR